MVIMAGTLLPPNCMSQKRDKNAGWLSVLCMADYLSRKLVFYIYIQEELQESIIIELAEN